MGVLREFTTTAFTWSDNSILLCDIYFYFEVIYIDDNKPLNISKIPELK